MSRKKYVSAALAVSVLCSPLSAVLPFNSDLAGERVAAAGPNGQGKWMTGDYHVHTYQSNDAQESLASVLEEAFETNELDWLALSDHLRMSERDDKGNKLSNAIPMSEGISKYQAPAIKALQESGKYSDKTIFTSFEWDMPTYDHANVGIITDEFGSEEYFKANRQFEYLFSNRAANLFDSAEVAEWNAKDSRAYTTAADTRKAFQGLADNYPESYALINHPSRKNNSSSELKVSDIRDFNDIAPNIVFGFEGMPGNQMAPDRGETVDLYGGADIKIAKVGGMWDALLGEGRKFWNFGNSDFHFNISKDRLYSSGYWPGEYTKNYTWVDGTGMKAVVEGLRSGKSYSVMGDLINALDFQASSGGNAKEMGQELSVAVGDNVELTIRFKSPATNNNGDAVQVDHIDLIGGDVTGKAQPGTAAYSKATNESAVVLKRFTANDWTVDAEGYFTMKYTVDSASQNQYFRLRGTNLGTDVPGETSKGEPLIDPKTTTSDNEARFTEINNRNYSDMWFYSNPIFVNVNYTENQAALEALNGIKLPAETSVDVELPLLGKQGAEISWESSNPAVATIEDGKVKVVRPALGEPDHMVTLTATATKGAAIETRAFQLNIKAVVTSDAALWYTFDPSETDDGIVADKSGNGHNATLVGGAELTGSHGGAVKLDGTSGAVKLPSGIFGGNADGTITISLKMDQNFPVPSWAFSFSSKESAAAGTTYLGLLEDGSSRFRATISNNWWEGEKNLFKGSALQKNRWKTIAYRISGTTATLYEDGAQIAQMTGVTTNFSNLQQVIANYIGKAPYPGDRYFKGEVADFRIYSRALSADEIAAVAAEDNGGTVADDKAALSLGDTSAVVSNLTLPSAGNSGSAISWATSNNAVIAANGTVVRPTDTTAVVALTATISKGAASDTKVFNVTVPATGDEGDVALDKQALSFGSLIVQEDLTLPATGAHGSAISWSTDNSGLIGSDGKVHRPEAVQNEKVTLTATIKKGDASASRTFVFTVLSQTPVIAHWKFSKDNIAAGTLEKGTLQLGDLSGLGNNLELVTTGNRFDTEAANMLKWSEDGNSMVFNNYAGASVGKYFRTIQNAVLGNERFMNGYTIEVLFKMPEQFTEAKHAWSGILTRQGAANQIGKTGGEKEVLSTLSISSLQELQWTSYPTNLQYNPTAWSLSLNSSEHLYHTAIVNDGSKTKMFINGVSDFRNPPDEMKGIDLVSGKGWNVGASEYNGRLDKLFAGTIQEIKITANALAEEQWVTQEYDVEGIIDGTNDHLPLVKNDQTYSIVFVPDTQNTVRYQPEIFYSQMQWLADEYMNKNIKMIVGLGDIVDQSWVASQWEAGDKGYGMLDQANAPYILTQGNHDVGGGAPNNYISKFGDARFANKSYWKGGSPSGTSSYALMEGGSFNYMVLSVDRERFTQDLNWAKNVLQQNSKLPTIIVSHESLIIGQDGKLTYSGNGQSLFNELVKNNNQVFMTIAGHHHGTDYRVVKNAAGNGVIEMLVDYQSYYNGGNGWLRFMEMNEAENQVKFRTYSPWVEQLPEDKRSMFDLKHLLGEKENFTLDFNFDERFGFYTKVGSVSGKALDGEAPLAGAKVVLTAGNNSYEAVTSADGSFKISNALAIGGYTLTISKTGYNSAVREDIALLSNRVFELGEIALSPKSVSYYTVTFDGNGEDQNIPAPVRVIQRGTIGLLPEAPSRTGYAFAGWNTMPDGSGSSFGEETIVTGDVTVYAQWSRLLLRYTFAPGSNGATVADSSGVGNDGQLLGGAQLGTENGGSVLLDGIDDAVKLPDGILSGLTDVTIAMNVKLDPAFARPAWLFTFSSDQAAKAGTKYLGLLEDGGGNFRASITPDWYPNEKIVEKGSSLQRNVWKSIVYTQSGNTAKLYEDGVLLQENANMGMTPADLGQTVANYIGKAPYSGDRYFKGLVSDFRIYTQALSQEEISALSAEQLASSGSVSGVVTADDKPVAGASVSVTVTGSTYKTVTAADGSYVLGKLPPGAGYTVLATKEGYEAGQASDVNVTADQITENVNISLIRTVYSVDFNSNGGDTEASPANVVVAAGEALAELPAAPSRAGYTFIGWNTQPDGSGEKLTLDTAIDANVTVYAQWKQNDPEVTTGNITGKISDGLVLIEGAAVSITVGEHVYSAITNSEGIYLIEQVPAGTGYTVTATKQGYESGSASLVNVTAGETTENVDIALSKTVVTFTVEFDGNGGNVAANPSTMTVAAGETVAALPTAPARTGYTFIGWNTGADGKGTAFTAATPVTANLKVYAQWRQESNTGNTGNSSSGSTTPPSTTDNKYVADASIAITEGQVAADLTKGSTLVSGKQMSQWVEMNKDRDIVLSGQGYAFTFAKGAMTAPAGDRDYDFSLLLNGGNTYDEIVELAGSQTALVVNYSFSGTLPGQVSIKLQAGVKYAGQTLYYYYFNEASKKLELVQSAVVDAQGFVTVKQSHFSDYVFTTALLAQETNGKGSKLTAQYDETGHSDDTVVPYVMVDGKAVPVALSAKRGQTIYFIGDSSATYAFTDNAKNFADVEGHWAGEFIDFVAARELMAGTGSGMFSPDKSMTRGMLITVLGRLLGFDADEKAAASSTFSDVDIDAYYAPYVEWAAANGIVTGMGNGRFAPDQEVTREQLAVMITRFLAYAELNVDVNGNGSVAFADGAQIGDWAKDSISKLAAANVINGKTDGRFDPQGKASRAEVAAVLKRMIEQAVQ